MGDLRSLPEFRGGGGGGGGCILRMENIAFSSVSHLSSLQFFFSFPVSIPV